MIEQILNRLDKSSRNGNGYLARCPAHNDKNPSLKLTELSDGRILVHCFAGCATHDVLSAIGLTINDLFPDGALGEYKGFQRIEENAKAKQKDKHFRDDIILEIAKSDRESVKRLNAQDLETERQAFMRIRAREQNART